MRSSLVSIEHMSKSFREGDSERLVLNKVSSTISEAEFVVLLGRSGCGKSTLLNLISGIDQPTAGRVVIDGRDLSRLSEHQRTLFRRENIGFVFQFYNLLPTLTVLENVLLPLELTGCDPGQSDQRARDLLARVDLADRHNSYPDRLSGGEQQRVAIARALVHRPRLLLADEPTGNLDAETGQQVLDLLIDLAREQQMTMLMVTHSEEIAGHADRIFKIHNGQLFEQHSDGAA